MEKLALFGGKKIITRKFKKYRSIGLEEKKAALKVLNSGVLSDFLGEKSSKFYGGKNVQKFERYIEKYFKVKHAISVNSWTSGLIAAVGAIGTEPGDEIIVPTWTMCASAVAILHWNAIPVFADIENETFNIDPSSIIKKINKKTKAIICVDIFGHPANMKEIMKIAKNKKLKVIADNAQAPGSKYFNKFSGTMADIGGISLNCHKHINTGEGGILITNNSIYAKRLRLIRNHAEAVVTTDFIKKNPNMLGYNFRMGEIESAIGLEQIKKLKKKIKLRQQIAKKLNKNLSKLKGLIIPKVKKNCTHSYYIYAMKIDENITGVSRDKIFSALVAEGIPDLIKNYFNLHLLPIYQNKLAYGTKGFPWKSEFNKNKINYNKGICPTAENLNKSQLILLELCVYEYSKKEIDLIIKCFNKVWKKLIK